MALKHFVLIFLFALFLSSLHEIQARDSQMFNKIPSKPNEAVVEAKQPEQNLPNKEQENQQPNFIPESTENSYGLYGHESGQFPPSTQTETQTQNNNNQLHQTNPNPQNNFPYNAKYLPKNYNTVAYVTQPEDFNDNTNTNNQQTKNNGNNYHNSQNKDLNNEFDFLDNEEGSSVNDNFNNKNSYYNNDVVSNNLNTRFMDVSNTPNNNNNYYNAQQKDVKNEFDFMDNEDNFANDYNNNYFNNDGSNNNNNNGNSYYNNDVVSNNNNNFNTRFMDASETNNNNNKNYYNSGKSRVNRAEPQGMSDTRFVENGKYHYDINTGKYSRDHPYVNTMAMRNEYNPTNTAYNNVDNSYQYNNYNEDVEQYQNEDNMP